MSVHGEKQPRCAARIATDSDGIPVLSRIFGILHDETRAALVKHVSP
jgi:hypothetical protein